jgi:lactoylglutathione lyase
MGELAIMHSVLVGFRVFQFAIGGIVSMHVGELESILLFVADLHAAKLFYVDLLGLPLLFEDGIVVVLRAGSGQLVLHRNDIGHDERGIFPVGVGATGVAVRFSVEDPDAWESEANQRGLSILWKTQEALWGRFVVIGDPDGRPVVLARMKKFG